MPYCTLTNLQAVEPLEKLVLLSNDGDVGQLDTSDPSSIGTVVVADAIATADALIDSYLRGHVGDLALPLDPVPLLITTISRELAIYTLYLRRMGVDMPDTIDARYKVALSQLKDIAAGRIIISETHREQQPSTQVKVTAPRRRFGQDQLDNYMDGIYHTGGSTLPGGLQ